MIIKNGPLRRKRRNPRSRARSPTQAAGTQRTPNVKRLSLAPHVEWIILPNATNQPPAPPITPEQWALAELADTEDAALSRGDNTPPTGAH